MPEPKEGAAPITPPAGSQGTPPPGEKGGTPAPQGQEGGKETVPLATFLEEKHQRQALQDEVGSLKDMMQTFQHTPPANQYQPGPAAAPQNDMKRQLDELWETDPRKALQTEMLMAFQWRDGVDAQLDAQLDGAKSTHKDFEKYESSVKQYIRRLPLDQRNKNGIVELAYYAVRGQDVDNLVKSEVETILAKIKAGEQVQGFTTGTRSGIPAPAGNQQLSEDELKIAGAMGLTAEQYQQNKK